MSERHETTRSHPKGCVCGLCTAKHVLTGLRCLEWVGQHDPTISKPDEHDPEWSIAWDGAGDVRSTTGATLIQAVQKAMEISEESPADLPSLESDSALLVGWMLERTIPWVRPEQQDLEEALERCRDRLPSEDAAEHTANSDLRLILDHHAGKPHATPSRMEQVIARCRERLKDPDCALCAMSAVGVCERHAEPRL